MEMCLGFNCLGVSVLMHGPSRVPSTSEIRLGDCLGASVRVLGMKSKKGTDNGWMGGAVERCLAFHHLNASAPTRLPSPMPGSSDTRMATACVPPSPCARHRGTLPPSPSARSSRPPHNTTHTQHPPLTPSPHPDRPCFRPCHAAWLAQSRTRGTHEESLESVDRPRALCSGRTGSV